MRTVELTVGDEADRVYREVLVPAFPPAELVTLDEFRAGLREGAMEGAAVIGDDGRILGAAVGEWSPSCRVLLLGYLAVAADARDGGIGSTLHLRQLDRWRAKYDPCLMLAEVERPDAHHASEAYGDPTARLRFYGRHGARALDVPYFQPALGGGRSRVPGMLLLALHVAPELAGPGGPETVAAEPVRTFLTEYLILAEGRVGDDAATVAMLRSLDHPDGVRLLPVDRFAEIPAGD
nr:GNAT family N-acetyltransferase [Micromonospora sp. DSM 115978]